MHNHKIKVLHIVDCLGGGGVEEWIKSICAFSDKDKFLFKVFFCGHRYDNTLFDYSVELKKIGIEIIGQSIDLGIAKKGLLLVKEKTDKNYFLKQLRRVLLYFHINILAFIKLIKLLRKERFDIIHIHLYRLFLSAGFVGKIFRIPVIHTVPGLKAQFDSYLPLIYAVYKKFNYLADIFVTGASKNELITYANIPERKIKVIGVSMDLTNLQIIEHDINPAVREFSIEESFPVLLSVGRLDIEKGHEYSIRAVAKLMDKFPKIKLIILGDGQEKASLNSLISKMSLNKTVIMPGYRKDLQNFHSLADIYLRTSIYEGANMASIIAMAYGTPVVGFDTHAETEVIVNMQNGVLVSTKDFEKLAIAVEELLKDTELRKNIGRRARDYVFDNCDIMKTVKIYNNLYAKLTEKGKYYAEK